jgi:hypothetical protein
MSGSYDQRAAARDDAALMVTDLMKVSGMLEEVATVWRRAELFGQQPPSSSPENLQTAAKSLADTLLALPDADCDTYQALAFSAVAQLVALESSVVHAAEVTGNSPLCDTQMWTTVQGSLHRVGRQLWSLISHLVRIQEISLAEDAISGVSGR